MFAEYKKDLHITNKGIMFIYLVKRDGVTNFVVLACVHVHACIEPFCDIAVSKVKQAAVVERYFYQLWRELLENGVHDPDTDMHYAVEVSNHHA